MYHSPRGYRSRGDEWRLDLDGCDMSALEWAVLLGGVAAIAWVNWYFFLAGRNAGAAADDAGEE